jgi:hypothetical protein
VAEDRLWVKALHVSWPAPILPLHIAHLVSKSMAPHMSKGEQDNMLKMHRAGKAPKDILAKIVAQRVRRGIEVPEIGVVWRFLKGETHRRSAVEARGRHPKLSKTNVLKINCVRKDLVKKARGTRYVKWNEVVSKARVPNVCRTTAARSLVRAGIDVKFRRCREKPRRTSEHKRERKEVCNTLRRHPESFFTDYVDMIIDNKQFDVPTTQHAREHLKASKVRGQIRTKQEGLKPGFTKPNDKRHRRNFGGVARVCAGIAGGKVVLWEYLSKRWCGEEAAKLYKGPIIKTLKRTRGVKRSYLLMEDNDPTGYKSGKGKAAKRDVKIRTVRWPRYSPDLNPLDFSLWENVSERMKTSDPKGRESVSHFKSRLRRTALRTSPVAVRKMVASMRSRARAIYEADGNDIARD